MTEADALPNRPMNTLEPPHPRPMRALLRTATVGLVAGALALPSASVLAAEPPAASPTEATAAQEVDPAKARSQALFEQGLDAYEADDYAGAAQSWTEAHELMAKTPELATARRVLGFDLAQAQMRAYARDHHQSRVVAAKPLLEGFVAWVDRPGHTMDQGETQDRARAVELLEQIEQLEHSSSEPPTPLPPPEAVQPARAPTDALPPTAPKPNGTGLLVGGGLALGGSVASIAIVFAMSAKGRAAEDQYDDAQRRLAESLGEPERSAARAEIDAAERDGQRANIGLLTAASSAALLAAAGITMLAIGGRRRSRHVSASAGLSPNSAAASVSVRF